MNRHDRLARIKEDVRRLHRPVNRPSGVVPFIDDDPFDFIEIIFADVLKQLFSGLRTEFGDLDIEKVLLQKHRVNGGSRDELPAERQIERGSHPIDGDRYARIGLASELAR